MQENKLAKGSLSSWGGLSFACRCGKRHEINVKDVVAKDGALSLLSVLPRYLKKNGFTAQVAVQSGAQSLLKELQAALSRFDCVFCVLPDKNLLSVEDCEQTLSQAQEQTGLFICVGGANAAAYGKYAAAKTNAQWVMLAVLPDADDFAANNCLLWQDGIKRMFTGRAPDVLLCDFNAAFALSKDLADDGVALALRNIMSVFDNVFAYAVQGGGKCNTANYIITKCVSDALSLAGTPYTKQKITSLMTCLLRISLAKSLCKAGTQYLCGAHAFTFALQTKYPEFSEGALALPVCDALCKVYSAALESGCKLLLEKDNAEHALAAKRLLNVDVQPSSQPDNEEAFAQNGAAFAKNLLTAAGVVAVAAKNAKSFAGWNVDEARQCLRLCTDVYSYGGMLSYLCDKGYLEGI